MKTRRLALAWGGALLAFPLMGLAHEAVDEGSRGLGAHVHGQGRLDLAQDGAEVHLRLEVPAASVVGFEHVPRRDLELVALEKAVAALSDGPALFKLSAGAGCALAEV
ncbi:MAG: ZrgA family zinc uptake protein, partial [Bdellovibrio bacteriovorus]